MFEKMDMRLLDPGEVAQMLHLGKSTVYKIAEEDLPCVRFGRSVRFLYEDVIDYIDKNHSGHKDDEKDVDDNP